MDKAVFKRLVRGLGLPGRRTGSRSAPRAGPRDPRWRARPSSRRSPPGTGDPRLMVKPARPRQLGGDDPRARRRASGRAALDEAFRFDDLALVERYLAGARDLEVSVLGNEPDEIELYGPGEIMSGHEFYDYAAKYMPGLSRDDAQRRGHAAPAGVDAQARARRVPGRRRARASRGSTSCWPARRSSCPRSTRSRASRRSACSRRCARPAATTSPRSAGGSWISRSARDAGRGSGTGSRPRTCRAMTRPMHPPPREPPGTAARPTRPYALRPGARPGGGVRRTRPVRRASAGLTPVRAGALLALLSPRAAPSTASPRRTRSPPAHDRDRATWTSEERDPRGARHPGRHQHVHDPDGRPRARPGADPRRSARRHGDRSRCRTRSGSGSRSARPCCCGGSGAQVPRGRRGPPVRRARCGRSRGGCRSLPVVDDAAPRPPWCSMSARRWTR